MTNVNVLDFIHFSGGSESVTERTLTVSGLGGSLSVTSIEQNLGSTPAFRGKFTVVNASISATSKILIWQRFDALTGKGTRADENEMDKIEVSAQAEAGQMTVYWQTQSRHGITAMSYNGQTSARPNLTYPLNDVGRIFSTKRIGRVRGNFKFNYTIA